MRKTKQEPDANGELREQMQELTREVHALREEVQVLRMSIDEFRDDLVHVLRNPPEHIPPPIRIHSLPLDPTAADFGDRINAVPPEQMEALRAEAVRSAEPKGRPAPAGRQTRLFS
jgi:hypothetical protein